ncbi:hypothetical protein [Capnocytophaga catalasegens]|uniref:Uncharacterized protein n=1 Tax=Capnocytophaga catalasegens TaxID=1004260 RepID=A0AAV5B0R1_9FLAO|nr:hypothetical protein [Capnocytophaga catalasegens]GIZ15434.1 hypothetical protein RCZ03_14340 [Capnocytophaga catalasegens]GJM51022.1 hypothetical protein RCZ15_19950 [Capnocytophaga catalasegens]GJM52207.1 hypothetical protein RCZ16_05250 [Capnocytophaga catalasegens]
MKEFTQAVEHLDKRMEQTNKLLFWLLGVVIVGGIAFIVALIFLLAYNA